MYTSPSDFIHHHMWWNRLSLAITTQRALPKSNLYSWQKYESQAFIPSVTYAHNSMKPLNQHRPLLQSCQALHSYPTTTKKSLVFNVYKKNRIVSFAKCYSSYSAALGVTVGVGCLLLVLNMIIFAGIYYQRERSRRKGRSSRCNNGQGSGHGTPTDGG